MSFQAKQVYRNLRTVILQQPVEVVRAEGNDLKVCRYVPELTRKNISESLRGRKAEMTVEGNLSLLRGIEI